MGELPDSMAVDAEGEVCQKCGESVRYVWHAPDKLWKDVTGFMDGNGVLCLRCFDGLVWERLHRFLYWSCDTRGYPSYSLVNTLGRLRRRLRQMRLERWLRQST